MLNDYYSYIYQVLNSLKTFKIQAYINKYKFYILEIKIFDFIIIIKSI